MQVPRSVCLQVSKAINQLDFVQQSLRLNIWGPRRNKEDWIHDLEIMATVGDLKSLNLEVIGHTGKIIYAHRIAFTGLMCGTTTGCDNGIELPLIPPVLIASSQLNVTRNNHDLDSYRPSLRCRWATVNGLPRETGSTFSSDHAASITGGRNSGDVFVMDEARHLGTITKALGDFAFTRDDILDRDVFQHRNYATPGLVFRVGDRVSYIIVMTRRGLQGRMIKAAPPNAAVRRPA